ncbi:MAG: DUF4179 domain-containing protein, partial [Lachnospiraceae bacterium]|nr:DUF4179 domain-containing protein [Lachnospiraceae bacterium]
MKMEFREIPVPKELDQVVAESLKTITIQSRQRNLKLWAFRGGAAAAACVCVIVFCMSNPSLAADLPLIGHIFEKMQDDFPYSGDYNGIGEQLATEPVSDAQNAEETAGVAETSDYTQTANGVTVTLSEMYCNSQALYITVQIQSKEKFPEISSFSFEETTAKFSFLSEDSWLTPTLDGAFIDDNTFAGLLRFDLNGLLGYNDSELKLPDTYSVELKLNRLVGNLSNVEPPDLGVTEEEIDAMSDEEWDAYMKEWYAKHSDYYDSTYTAYSGPWTFDLEVTQDKSDMQVVEINEKNEQGIGFSRVVRDRFEITMYESSKNPQAAEKNYFPVMLDADGDLMTGNDGWVNVLEIGSHDVSTVDLFLVDEVLWLDELKGIYWDNPWAETYDGKTFKEILLENCAYHKEIS